MNTPQDPAQAASPPGAAERVQPDGPLSGEVKRGGFTLDTSGFVEGPPQGVRTKRFWWKDLTPFQQGYVEAALRPREGLYYPLTSRFAGFSDLAPETLAAMLKDCASFVNYVDGLGSSALGAREGARFWNGRNSGALGDGAWAAAFPPVTLYLGDDGRVYAREA
jgi:hypothetical protein